MCFKKDLIQILKDTIVLVVITLVIYLFQLLSHYVNSLNNLFSTNNILEISLYSILVLVLGIFELSIVFFYDKKEDNLSSLSLRNKKNKKRFLLFKILVIFITCLISFFIGLALGEEGPSVLIGSIIGLVVGRIASKDEEEIKLTNLGGAIGFSLAFLNPIAGLLKYHKYNENLSKSIREYLRVIYSLVLSYILLSLLKKDFHYFLYFDLDNKITTPVSLIFLILPFIIFIFSFIFKRICKRINKIVNKHKIFSYFIYPFVILVLAIILKIYYPALKGSGSSIINNILTITSLSSLLIYFLIRFIFLILSFTSKFKGGIVIPSVTLGFLLGKLIAECINNYIYPLSNDELIVVSIISGCLFYSFTFKELFVGASLIFSFGNPIILLPPLIISISISYILFKVLPIYSINEFINEKFSSKLML